MCIYIYICTYIYIYICVYVYAMLLAAVSGVSMPIGAVCIHMHKCVWIPFGDHPLKLERYMHKCVYIYIYYGNTNNHDIYIYICMCVYIYIYIYIYIEVWGLLATR